MKCLLVFLFLGLPLALAHWVPYCFNVALALDVLASAYLGGKPGETLSGRAGSALQQGKLRGKIFAPIIDRIMGRKGHCLGAVEGDVLRAEAVIKDQSK